MNLSRPHWFHAGLPVGCGRLYCHAGMGGASSIAAPGQLRAISTLRSAGALVRTESNTRRQILTSSRPQYPLLQAQDLRTQAESRPHAPTPTPSASRSRVAGTRASVPRAGLRSSAARRSCCALPDLTSTNQRIVPRRAPARAATIVSVRKSVFTVRIEHDSEYFVDCAAIKRLASPRGRLEQLFLQLQATVACH
jgi:hypothetical protein